MDFWVFNSILLIYLSVSVPIPCDFYHCCSLYSLKSGMVIPSEVLLLLRIVFAILGFLLFWMKLRIALSISVRNYVGILMGIALNLKIVFDKMAIFTILILPIHEHGRWELFHLLIFSISFFRDLKFLSYKSFICLARVMPGYFILFVTSVNHVVSLISFSAHLSFE